MRGSRILFTLALLALATGCGDTGPDALLGPPAAPEPAMMPRCSAAPCAAMATEEPSTDRGAGDRADDGREKNPIEPAGPRSRYVLVEG